MKITLKTCNLFMKIHMQSNNNSNLLEVMSNNYF